jgi:hypothetical protein
MEEKLIKTISLSLLLLMLAACKGGYIPLAVVTPITWPSPLPAIHSPTPRFIPTATPTIIILPATPTNTQPAGLPPTEYPTYTLVSTPATTPGQPSNLVVDILECNTSNDILHSMGVVTNAFPIIRNYTGANLNNVCAALSASDEARTHPDKIACAASLPAGFQVTLKLTVDTGVSEDTTIQVLVTSTEGFEAKAESSSCTDIGLPGWTPDEINVIEPIHK